MSFLKKIAAEFDKQLWIVPEHYSIPTYPEKCKKYLERYLRAYEVAEQNADQLLANLKLPLPVRVGKHLVEYDEYVEYNQLHKVLRIHPPEFILPQHLLFDVLDVAPGKPDLYGLIFADRTTLEEAKKAYAEHNITNLVKEYPVRWFVKDPYEFYRALDKHRDKTREDARSVACSSEIWHTDKYPSLPYVPEQAREECSGYTLPKLKLLKEQLHCLRMFLDCAHKVPDYVDDLIFKEGWKGKVDTYNFPYQLLVSLPVPEKFLPDDCRRMKILPAGEIKPNEMSQLFEALGKELKNPLSFEVVSQQGSIYYQIAAAPADYEAVRSCLELYGSTVSKFSILDQPSFSAGADLVGFSARPKLAFEFSKTTSDFPIDPYSQLFATLEKLDDDATAVYQVLSIPFPVRAYNALTQYLEQKLPSAYPAETKKTLNERLRAVKAKHPAWLIEIKCSSTDPDILSELKRRFLSQFETFSQGFQFRDAETTAAFTRSLAFYSTVSTEELVAIAHFPTKEIACDRLERAEMKNKLPPTLYTEQGAVIGTSTARGITKTVTFPDSIRNHHAYIIGRTGSGKSTLLTNLIVQDIEAGKGMCVLDPHGELTESILDYIPEERVKDVIYLDVTDEAHPIPLNILNSGDTGGIALLVDDLISTFKRLVDSSTWTPRMEAILRQATSLLVRQPRPHSFLDIRKVLRNPDYRDQLLNNVTYEPLHEFWKEDAKGYGPDAYQPLINRLARFSDFPTLYAMLSNPKSQINFDEIMQQRKILLVNPAAGIIGDENSKLIGCLIVSQLQLAAMRRARIPPEQRVPFSLYVDEFQNFIASPFDRILNEARKYQLCLTFAHQFISQLDDNTRNAILGNVGTVIVLPINEKDARTLHYSLGDYEITDILNLDSLKHEALCRPDTKASDTFPFVTNPKPQRLASSNRQAIIEHTRAVYAARMDEDGPIAPQPIRPQEDFTTPKFCPHCGTSPAAGTKFCMHCGTAFLTIPQTHVTFQSREHSAEQVPEQLGSTEPDKQTPAIKIRIERPLAATPKTFASNRDKVVHYLTQAQYLTTPQIINLCYTQKTNASSHLTKLVAENRIKEIATSRPKIYYIGATPNVTEHNLFVREIFVKIAKSNFEISKVNFNLQLGDLNPDLFVEFVLPNGNLQKTFWEFDNGTEGTKELKRKVERYKKLSPTEIGGHFGGGLVSPRPPLPVIFVFKDSSVLNRVMPAIETSFTFGVVLSEFETMDDAPFKSLFL